MALNKFSDTPNYKHDHPDDRYLGTWYYNDCYVAGSTLIVRHSDEPSDCATHSCVGWNYFHPTNKCGGLGEDRTRCEIQLEGIPGYNNDANWAAACAMMFLGREYLDRYCSHKCGN